MNRIKTFYRNLSLAKKIRFSYLVIIIPFIVLLTVTIINIQIVNNAYTSMLQSVTSAGAFSLDFKKDFDDEIYLLIVGNKTVDDNNTGRLLDEAGKVVEELKSYEATPSNRKRIESALKYINNLSIYTDRIINNIDKGDSYEKNIEIWENDIQIVSSLLQETMSEYIYYEIKDYDEKSNAYRLFYYKMLTVILISVFAVGIAVVILSVIIPKSISKPISIMSDVTLRVAEGDLSARSKINEGGEVKVLSDSLNKMIEKINELLEQVTTEQKRLRDSELELLTAQINPHFLYNTLDTIVWLAEGSDKDMVVSMVKSLSEFFRTSLNKGNDIISINEESTHVRSYLEIQQVRYRDILEYEIEISEEIKCCRIPKITLQPLVENALYHGIKNKRGLGKIVVRGYRDNDYCKIEVIDNGRGMTEERLEKVRKSIMSDSKSDGEVFGLSNVNDRIKLKFGDEYGLSIDSVLDEGSRVLVTLPMDK